MKFNFLQPDRTLWNPQGDAKMTTWQKAQDVPNELTTGRRIGGYAACFENALLHVSRDAGHRFADDDVDVVARIVLGRLESPDVARG
jgi:organic hydroperoxide reductase OsmC/OhrA